MSTHSPRVSFEVYFNIPHGEICPLILTHLNSYGTEGVEDLSHPDRWNFKQSPITLSLVHLLDIVASLSTRQNRKPLLHFHIISCLTPIATRAQVWMISILLLL